MSMYEKMLVAICLLDKIVQHSICDTGVLDYLQVFNRQQKKHSWSVSILSQSVEMKQNVVT